ncbi:MAG: S41 family peptidase, partial [Pseudomonadota bacterium]
MYRCTAVAVAALGLAACSTTISLLPADFGAPADALAPGAASAANDLIEAEALQADIALAKEALERIHPGYNRFTSKAALDAAWADLTKAAADGMTRDAFYLGLSHILADIRCDHTKAELPTDMRDARDAAPSYLPVRYRIIDGRFMITEPGNTGLLKGDEILEIDAIAVSKRYDAVAPYLAIDGFTDHVKPVIAAMPGDFGMTEFDHYDTLLQPDTDGRVVFTIKSETGTIRTVDLARVDFAGFRALGDDAGRVRDFSDPAAVSVRQVASNTAQLTIETFVNYRTPVDPDTVFGPIFENLNADGVETLILDMRPNGGGSTDVMQSLLSHLTRTPMTRLKEVRVKTIDFDGLRDHIGTWDERAMNPDPADFVKTGAGWLTVRPELMTELQELTPAEHAFRGEVILLIGAQNASGATQMIGALAGQPHVTLVGEKTGGVQDGPTAGIIYFLSLPASGITVRVPWQWQVPSIEDPEFGVGFTPDVRAP